MTVNAIESGTGDVWQVKQAALGTIQPPADAGMKHLRKVGDGALRAAKTYGSEEWVDGKAWGSPGMYVDSIGGDVGDVVSQGQIETVGFQVAQVIGVDTVTGTASDYTHTIASGTANGAYQTFRQKVGVSVGPWRNSFFDAKINKLTLNCGQDQKVMHVTQNVWALKAANWFTTDPTATDSGTDPFNWNEATGAVTIGGVAFPEIDGETLELDRKLDVHRGDSAAPVCFIPGKGQIDRSFSALVTDNTIPVIQNALYGTTTMTDGLTVGTAVNTLALESTYTRTAVRSLKITTPKVVVNPEDFAIGPRAEGGKIPVAFGGRCLDNGGTPMITVVAKTGDASAYV
jgi:hypothetical protein